MSGTDTARGAPLLADLLADARGTLAAAGVDDPPREAVGLWSAVTGERPGAAWLRRWDPVEPGLRARFRRVVRRRAAGEPAAYAVGTAAFRTLELVVDRRVLIPRPETEGLVELVLRWAAAGPRGPAAAPPRAALDVGTGSGCIALALAVEGPFERIVATDVSPGALAVARANRARARPRVPVEFRMGSLLEVVGPEERFDVIVANPPYITTDEYTVLDPAVRRFEPRVALVGGPDGLDPVRALVATAGRVLRPGGLVAVEVDARRADAARELACAAGWTGARVATDLSGRPRYLLVTTT